MGELTESPHARFLRLIELPNFIDNLCENIASGSRLVEVAEVYDIPYGQLSMWLYSTQENKKKYMWACDMRAEWSVDSILSELRHLARVDIRTLFDERGNLLDPHDWPDHTAKAVSGLKVKELFDRNGNKEGEIIDVKLWDKIKSLELLGKNLKMFTDKHEHSVDKKLEDLLAASMGEI